MEAPPRVVTLEAAMQLVNQLVALKSQHVGAKSLLAVQKSLLAVAKATVATPVATVLVAKIVDADFWRSFSPRKATATDVSQHVVVKKSQHVVARATAAIAAVLL